LATYGEELGDEPIVLLSAFWRLIGAKILVSPPKVHDGLSTGFVETVSGEGTAQTRHDLVPGNAKTVITVLEAFETPREPTGSVSF